MIRQIQKQFNKFNIDKKDNIQVNLASSTKRNRGQEANDSILFGIRHYARLKSSFEDLNELLTKGYPINASLSLIGNHNRLNKRQRTALKRCAAGEGLIKKTKANELTAKQIKGNMLLIDGFNLLILLESAMSGAFIFESADGTFKDLSGVHGSYKRVSKTHEALILVGERIRVLKPSKIVWIFDKPVSNSGRIKKTLELLSDENNFNWEVLLDNNPDAFIAAQNEIAVSSDSWIIERSKWYNLGKDIIETSIMDSEIIRFNNL